MNNHNIQIGGYITVISAVIEQSKQRLCNQRIGGYINKNKE